MQRRLNLYANRRPIDTSCFKRSVPQVAVEKQLKHECPGTSACQGSCPLRLIAFETQLHVEKVQRVSRPKVFPSLSSPSLSSITNRRSLARSSKNSSAFICNAGYLLYHFSILRFKLGLSKTCRVETVPIIDFDTQSSKYTTTLDSKQRKRKNDPKHMLKDDVALLGQFHKS
jgi:hypothetical protein